MTGFERRKKIMEALKESDGPVSATKLGELFSVSRQIIVGDIQLLRAEGTEIMSTVKGYSLVETGITQVIKVRHKPEDFYDEMCTIVDMGGGVIDEIINHQAYGEVKIPLNITNRSEAKLMAEKFEESPDGQLSELTRGVHFHTVSANSDLAFLRIQKALNDKGYIAK